MITMNDWIEVGAGITWDFKQDKEIVGNYISKQVNVGSKSSNLYTLKKLDGTVIGVWGNTMLDDKFKSIDTGEDVKIVYLGEETSKSGNRYHNFKVYHKPQSQTVQSL